MADPVLSHIKFRQNLHRFKRKRMHGVKIEYSLQMMTCNIKRAVALANRVESLM